MADIPPDLADLLERPLYGALATVRPDGSAQNNPMWFEWIDGTLQFTHTTKRAKYRNLQANPSMSLLVIDPDDALRFIEVRGTLTEAVPDPTGAFYVRLGRRYGNPGQTPPPDSPDRVVLVMSIDKVQRK